MHSQKLTLPAQVQRKWHQIDVSKKPMGRVATEIANLLRGKPKEICASRRYGRLCRGY